MDIQEILFKLLISWLHNNTISNSTALSYIMIHQIIALNLLFFLKIFFITVILPYRIIYLICRVKKNLQHSFKINSIHPIRAEIVGYDKQYRYIRYINSIFIFKQKKLNEFYKIRERIYYTNRNYRVTQIGYYKTSRPYIKKL